MKSRVSVILGGGGVGKTTAAAALGLALARAGARVLVVTVDPAQRLADTLGARVGIEATPVVFDTVSMHARMPDSRRSAESFGDWLFAEHPKLGARVRENPLYRELADALIGIHEMVCVTIVDQELESGRYDEVVLDTAPSRHALEFLDAPVRLAEMLEARTVRWVAAMAAHTGSGVGEPPPRRGVLSWGKRRIQGLLARVAGSQAIHDVSELFEDLLAVRGRWLGLLRSAERRLVAPAARYLVVSTPSGAALDDAGYLLGELDRRQRPVDRLLLNRTVRSVPGWLTDLDPGDDAALRAAHRTYLDEYRARARQTRAARRRLVELAGPDVALTLLPALPTSDPRAIVVGLADALSEVAGR